MSQPAFLLLLGALGLQGCGGTADSAGSPAALDPRPDATCAGVFYGTPSANTGMEAPTCVPSITGTAGTWTPPPWPEDEVSALAEWSLVDPPAVLSSDPYAAGPPDPPQQGAVCAVQVEDAAAQTYRLQTHPSVEDAWAAQMAALAEGGSLSAWVEGLAAGAGR